MIIEYYMKDIFYDKIDYYISYITIISHNGYYLKETVLKKLIEKGGRYKL